MPIRDPHDNSVETLRKLVEDLRGELRGLRGLDLKGRRQSNASDAVLPADLVTKRQLDILASQVQDLARRKPAPVRKTSSVPIPGGTLPAPNHPMTYAYWFVDRASEGDPMYGDFYDEVKGYTSSYHAFENRGYGQSGTPTQTKVQRMAASLARAAGDGRQIMIQMWSDFGTPTLVDFRRALDAVAIAGVDLVWPKVYGVNLCDEFIQSRDEAEESARVFRNLLRQRNLEVPPEGLGITLTPTQVLDTDIAQASGLDFISIEAYVDPPGSDVSAENIAALREIVSLQKAAVPNGKKLSVNMMGYARNGNPSQGTYGWPNFDTLADLQIPTYEECMNDERVFELLIFSYGRYSGTRDIDRQGAQLGQRHRLIGAAILGSTTQQTGCRKLTTGGQLADLWVEVMDRAIAENQHLVEYINGITYVIAGSEGAFVAAVVALFNEPQYGTTCIQSTVEQQIVLIKPVGGSFSEAYAVYASDRRVRYTDNAYLLTCVPPEF